MMLVSPVVGWSIPGFGAGPTGFQDDLADLEV